ncbi:hypothetical protein [Oceaniglobus roseus]|uniref:hypothetical protein n=1 Tax=Oceaniglobus roseus TaxID=1737570 RepID=UPI000C7EB3B0|nr:hypothetical protein [Kandeliimicrobium roseum]
MTRTAAVPALLATLTLLAACEVADVTTPPVNITPKVPGDAVGLDVYARPRARGNPVPRFRGQETVTVRTRGTGAQGGSTEITGLACQLDSGIYTARFQTPANVIVPNYGPNSPALFIRCTHPDGRSGSSTVTVYNATAEQRSQNAAGGGLLGAVIVGAINAARTDPERDEFKYRNATVSVK